MEAATFTAPAALASGRGGRLLRLRTDDQLVALFRFGNDEAFSVIHDRYRVRLLAYTRQMLSGSRSDAEDALQDVFLRAYGALRADDRPVTLRAWLYRVAHNRCIDHMRRPANQPTSELFENVHSLHDPTVEAEQREDLARLIEDVRRLPEQQRSALLMRELEGLSYAELADALNVSVPSVKSLLVRARIGLTEAREARDTACVQIRSGISDAHDRGVRITGQVRRHLRDCEGCCDYRTQLKRMRERFATLGGGGGGWASLAKLIGIGGAGSSAAATGGGGAAAGGSLAGGSLAGGSVASGSLVAAGGTKVAALVCSAAVLGGGAVEARQLVQRAAPPARTESKSAAPAVRAVAIGPVLTARRTPPAVRTERVSERLVPVTAEPKADPVVVPVVLDATTPQVDAPAAAPRTLPADPADDAARQAALAGGAMAPDAPGTLAEHAAPQASAGGPGHPPAATPESSASTGPSEAAPTPAPASASVAPGKASASTGPPAASTTGPG